MSWSHPWALALLLLLPAWWWLRARGLYAASPVVATAQVGRALPEAVRPLHVYLGLECAFLAFAVAALAGPYRTETVDRVGLPGVDVALVLDISASMQAADLEPNRLEVLKDMAQRLVRGTAGSRVAVYAFAGFVATQAPLTDDRDALLALIESLSYRSIDHDEKSGGTAIGDALLLAADDLLTARVEGRDQVIVLVSDGENSAGADPVEIARQLPVDGFSLHVIGLGGDEKVQVFVDGKPFIGGNDKPLFTKLDDAQLQRVAEVARGTYARAPTEASLRAIFDAIATLHAKPLEATRVRVPHSLAPEMATGAALAFALALVWDALRLRRPLR